jgi:CheY-like chemotaxis protein
MTIENSHDPLNILLAEDDIDDRLFFDKAIKGIPLESHLNIVENGDQLMQYLIANTKHPPDVLFLDLSMPGMTGFECLTEIKANDDLKDIPVIIFTTSFGRSNEYEQSLIDTLTNIGSLAYLRKPEGLEALKQLIYTALIMVRDKKSLLKKQN